MNLTTDVPRSPNEKMAGLVSLARVIDKARAHNAGTLGEYHYDCPHDKPLLEFLGVDAATFAQSVRELGSDQAIEAWVRRSLLARKSEREIECFNRDRTHWKPYPDSDKEQYFDEMRQRIAPGRSDVTTWFELLDLEEGRGAEHRRAA